MGDITQLLAEMRKGDVQAVSAVMAMVYDELHRLAAAYMRHERPDHTLQPTALVHEAYLRLVDQRETNWQNRAHFLGVAALVMRRILINHAQAHHSAKRGGFQRKIGLEHAELSFDTQATELLAVDQALTRLAAIDPRQSHIVELRFFGGLTLEEAAEVVGVSVRTANRDWMVAKAWLQTEISRSEFNDTASLE